MTANISNSNFFSFYNKGKEKRVKFHIHGKDHDMPTDQAGQFFAGIGLLMLGVAFLLALFLEDDQNKK